MTDHAKIRRDLKLREVWGKLIAGGMDPIRAATTYEFRCGICDDRAYADAAGGVLVFEHCTHHKKAGSQHDLHVTAFFAGQVERIGTMASLEGKGPKPKAPWSVTPSSTDT
jgi:hypothetical protein